MKVYIYIALFINFLHEREWTNKSSGIYQLIHFTILTDFVVIASVCYADYFFGGGLLEWLNHKVIIILSFIVLSVIGNIWLLFLRKKPLSKNSYNNSSIVIGGIIWALCWIYIIPFFIYFL